jgi:hypothetical protein
MYAKAQTLVAFEGLRQIDPANHINSIANGETVIGHSSEFEAPAAAIHARRLKRWDSEHQSAFADHVGQG